MGGVKLEVGIKTYKDLEIYRESYKLVLEVYQLKLPKEERYGLTHQIKNASVSISLNIAEGYGRKYSAKEFKHFLRNSLGSTNEMQVLLELLKDLKYLDKDKSSELINRYDILGKRIHALIKVWN